MAVFVWRRKSASRSSAVGTSQIPVLAQFAYGPSGGFGLHVGHESCGMHTQPPPEPSQHAIPNAPHMSAQSCVQLHGSEGRGPGVGAGTGSGSPAATPGYDAISAMPQMPSADTPRAMRM